MTVDHTEDTSPLTKDAAKLLHVSSADFKAVMKNYDVTPEAATDMVKSIRDWLKKQPHLPEDKIQDKQIFGHLLFRGFSVEKVKRTIDDYFSARHRMPEITCNRDPLDPELDAYLKYGYWAVSPKKTHDDHRLSIFRLNTTEERSLPIILKIAFMFFEYRIWNDASMGDRWIIDLENVGLNLSLQMTPVFMSHMVFYIMACVGGRLKSIHIINMPGYTVTLVNIFKRMMPSKLVSRIFIATKEEVMNFYPKEILPKEYGGECGTFQGIADEWCKTIQSDPWRKHFIEHNNIFTDESKRLTPSSTDEMFGVDGSFRKLALD